MPKNSFKNACDSTHWLSKLTKTFDDAQRSARADLAAQMGERPDFFDTDPDAIDKMLAFMVEKGVITIERRKKSLCRPQRPAMN